MEPWLQTALTAVGCVLASSGFWAWLQARRDKKDAKTRMILGLGHDRIVNLSMKYIDRGWIGSDEYEDLIKYLWTPYSEMGGNGTAKRLIQAVEKLPIRKMSYAEQVTAGQEKHENKSDEQWW